MPKSLTLKELQSELKKLSNRQDALFLQRFFKTGIGEYGEGDMFRGIRVPVLRKLVIAAQAISLEQVEELLHSSYHEDRLLALLILVRKYNKTEATEQAAIYQLYLANTQFINNWDLVDASAHYIVGAYLNDKSQRPLDRLARSHSMWERRIAMMATFYFIKREQFDTALRIAKILLKDKEDLIHKAVGWMLREIGQRDIQKEEEFLMEHYQTMPRTMLRYAIEKFPEKKRKAYLKRE